MKIEDAAPEKNKTDNLISLGSDARALLSLLPLPVCLTDSIGLILETNLALEKISGYPIEEIIDHPLEKFLGKLDAKRMIKEALEKEFLSPQEITLTTKDKKKVHVSASALVYKNASGEILGCFISFFDLTAIKKNERDLRRSQSALLNMLEDIVAVKKKAEEEKNKTLAVITHLADGLLVFDDQNNLSLINPLVKKLLRIETEAINNKSLEELASLADCFKPLFKILGKEIKEVSRQEIILKDTTLEISSVSMISDGNKSGSLVIIHDVTREKAIERTKTEFVTIAAHQLRTPLSGIKWALSLLKDGDIGELNPEQKKFIEKGYESNERMITLVNNLLDVAQIEEGRYIYKLAPAKLEDLTQIALDYCKELATKRHIKIEYKKPTDYLPEIMVDAEKIIFAIQNLIENAIKYTLPGGQVTISLKYDINKVEFFVQDTGVGVNQEQQARLFTKFFRAANVMRLETDGNGLGLFIAKNVIKAHAGKIWFQSRENKGSTFSFSLPLKEVRFEKFIRGF